MSLREQFGAWYPLDLETRQKLTAEGRIVLDTNVLIALYRMNTSAREDLISLLRSIGDRLWIPHQVGLEFHRNRLTVIHDQEAIITKLRASLRQAEEVLIEASKMIRDHPTIDAKNFTDSVADGIGSIDQYLETVRTDLSISLASAISADPILAEVTALFDGRVGPPYPPERQEEIEKEAKRRVEHKIPPGFADSKKPDGRSSGDYIVWRQILDEASRESVPVLFITNDQKEDWYRRQHGMTVGPRIELILEMQAEAGTQFHAQTLVRFLETAPSLLNSELADNTFVEASRLDELDRVEDSVETAREYDAHPTATTGLDPARSGNSALLARRASLAARVEELRAQLARIPAEDRKSEDPRSYVRALETRLTTSLQLLGEVDLELKRFPTAGPVSANADPSEGTPR